MGHWEEIRLIVEGFFIMLSSSWRIRRFVARRVWETVEAILQYGSLLQAWRLLRN
jgi:hypothetical protein